MGNKVCNVAKGKTRYYAQLPAANDAIKVLLLKSAGLEADDALEDYTNIQALLAASNDECDFTNYARKTLAAVTDTITNGTNRWDSNATTPLTWAAAGALGTVAGSGAGNNVIGKAVFYYDPDTTASNDANNIPLCVVDFAASTDGNELDGVLAAAGWVGATD